MSETVGHWISKRSLSPESYDSINDDQEIEQRFRTPSGDEMIVFGMGEGRIINVRSGGGSLFESGDINEYLNLENNQDWTELVTEG